jgi:protein phosphatase
MIFRVSAQCSLGLGPQQGGRSRNEDNFLVAQHGTVRWREEELVVVHPWTGAGVLVAVADGMGGHSDGHIASLKAVQAVAGWNLTQEEADPEGALIQWISEAHHEIRATMSRPVQMGTTLVTVWLREDRAYWCHVGDSRLYVLRKGVLHLLTRDQTRSEFATRDRRPIPTHPTLLAQNFIFGSRGLGNDAGLRIERGVDSGSFRLEFGDRLLLSSDGVTGWLDETEVGTVLNDAPDPLNAARKMVAQAMAAKSEDNATAVVIFVDQQVLDVGATIIPD